MDTKDAYSRMASIVEASFEQLLSPLAEVRNPAAFLETTTADCFFQDFLVHATGFVEQSSLEFAKALRQFSDVPEVRGTPTSELSQKVRANCFERLDRILTSYLDALKELNLEMSQTSSGVGTGSVIDAALEGAAIGRLAGGLGRSGKALGTFNALLKGSDELLRQGALAGQKLELLQRASRLPFEKMVAFLETAASLPQELLDYGCAKCFGGQVDFSRQTAALTSVQPSCESKLKKGIEVARTLAKAQETKDFNQAQEIERAEAIKEKKSGGGCLVALGLLFTIGGIGALIESDTDDATGMVVLTFIGLVALVYGISKLLAGRFTVERRSPESATSKGMLPSAQTTSSECAVETFKKCPYCGREYANEVSVCPGDNYELVQKSRVRK